MEIKPYGDSLNDGMVQISFTLPIKNDHKATAIATQYCKKMGVIKPRVVKQESLDPNFTFFIIYGRCKHKIGINKIEAEVEEYEILSHEEIEKTIKAEVGRKIIILGAAIESDAHTVGLDAILSPKGFAGDHGLESYSVFNVVNIGSQVPSEELLKKTLDIKADVVGISQIVTQKNVHIYNLTKFLELAEGKGVRDKIILICGGPRISNTFANDLGYDAGFGSGTTPIMVASYIVSEFLKRKKEKREFLSDI